jgi:uncharacterized protein (UPF0332 family)
MNREFRECLEKKKIIPFPQGVRLISKELEAARADLEDGQFGLAHGKHKWSTIQGYYCMYHAARALLYSRGYRDKNHFCLFSALKALFVEEKLLSIEYVEAFYGAMLLREEADYKNQFTRAGAELVLKKANAFLKAAEELLNPQDTSLF